MIEPQTSANFRKRLSQVQGTMFKIIGNIESIKLLMIGSDSDCLAPCYPICCEDCPFGKLGDEIDVTT